MLCKKHEDIIGGGDDYAIRICRTVEVELSDKPDQKVFSIPNRDPERLMHFIYASVWRHAVSSRTEKSKLELGRYEEILRNALLNGGPYELQAIIGIENFTVNGIGRINLAIAPYRNRIENINIWHFSIGGLSFYLSTDNRKFDRNWVPYLANGNDPLIVSSIEAQDISKVPLLKPILQNMLDRQRG